MGESSRYIEKVLIYPNKTIPSPKEGKVVYPLNQLLNQEKEDEY